MDHIYQLEKLAAAMRGLTRAFERFERMATAKIAKHPNWVESIVDDDEDTVMEYAMLDTVME